MEYIKNSVALAFTDPKAAALFFNSVIPGSHSAFYECAKYLKPTLMPSGLSGMSSISLILTASIGRACERHSEVDDINELVEIIFEEEGFPEGLEMDAQSYKNLMRRFVYDVKSKEFTMLNMLFDELGDRSLMYYGYTENNINDEVSVNLVLSNLPTIRTKNLDWEKILELRKDEESIAALRTLRTFVYENYQNKPIDYISDDLDRRKYEYMQASKKWELEILQSTLTLSGIEKLVGAGATGLVAALGGASLTVSAAVGVSAILGATTASFITGKNKFKLDTKINPINYLIRIDECNEEKKNA
jgi:hypothetical protein